MIYVIFIFGGFLKDFFCRNFISKVKIFSLLTKKKNAVKNIYFFPCFLKNFNRPLFTDKFPSFTDFRLLQGNKFISFRMKKNKQRFNMDENNHSTGRIFLGAILIISGALFLTKNFGLIDEEIMHTLFSLPSIFIFVGLLSFFNSSKKWVGTLLVVVGSGMHLSRIYNFDFGDVMLPLILIGVGFMILVKHNRNGRVKIVTDNRSSSEIKEDRMEDISIFGGSSKFYTSDNFKGGNITSIFGGSEINLSGCTLAPGENIIDVIAIFGGTTILVPKEWNVIVEVFPLFGGFGTKGKKDPMVVIDKTRTLRIKGVVIFGGGEIKLIS